MKKKWSFVLALLMMLSMTVSSFSSLVYAQENDDDTNITSEVSDEDKTFLDESKTVEEESEKIEEIVAEKDEKLEVLKANNSPANRGELSLDDVTIDYFKIIDTTHENVEIDYRTSDQPDFVSYSEDPTKFSNDICDEGRASKITLKLGLHYNSDTPLQEGDSLVIPASYGGRLEDYVSQKLFDADNNELGTWEYKNGSVIIKFSGDYIRNNIVKKFTASFQTGEMRNLSDDMGKTFIKGERILVKGKLGKKDLISAYEKYYVQANHINKTNKSIGKFSSFTTDSQVEWGFSIYNDIYAHKTVGTNFNPYLLENNGQYPTKVHSGIYVEDTFFELTEAPSIKYINVCLSGITDDGKVISGYYAVPLPTTFFKKIDQADMTREEVKATLKHGEYCVYANPDGSFTLMLKMWDINDNDAPKYDDLPLIKSAGGVGNYLKKSDSQIFGNLSQDTIDKINQIYKDKTILNIDLVFSAQYVPAKEKTQFKNTAQITTNELGTKDFSATATLHPATGVADAPADPLSLKMLKTDKDTGADLSTGFNFELQTSADNGANWTKVNLDSSMVEIGTLNDDKTITPDAKGAIQVKKLIGGNMYRFVEKTHADGYQDLAINNEQPNDKDHPASANSRAVTVTTQGKGHVIVMYNVKPETVSVSIEKKWIGKELDSVRVYLYADGKEVTYKDLNKENDWKWTFNKCDKFDADGKEIEYTVKEVPVKGYDTTIEGNVADGFVIINKEQTPWTPMEPPTRDVKVTKDWKGADGNILEAPIGNIEVELYKDGNPTGIKKELTKDNNWTATFEKLAVYESITNQAIHKYTVKEVGENNNSIKIEDSWYKVSITGDMKDGFTITNMKQPPLTPMEPPTRDVKVIKDWKGIKPPVDKIEVELYKDGVATGIKKELTKANNWTTTFEKLKLSATLEGKAYEYTVKEVGENNGSVTFDDKTFKVSYEGNMKDGFKVINKYEKPKKPEPKEPEKPKVPNTESKKPVTLPKTGDSSNVFLYSLALGLSSLGLLSLGFFRRKRTKEN